MSDEPAAGSTTIGSPAGDRRMTKTRAALLTVVIVVVSAAIRAAIPEGDVLGWKIADYAIFAFSIATLVSVWERAGAFERGRRRQLERKRRRRERRRQR